MSGIFVAGVARFVGTGTPDSNTVILYNSVLEPNFSEKSMIMFESPVSEAGTRTWKNRGRHATFDVFVNLHKYDTAAPGSGIYATAKAFASALLTYENQDVVFYPFYSTVNLSRPITNERATIISASEADPCVIGATAHGFSTGDFVKIHSVSGMTEINQANYYKITYVNENSFSLDGIDSSGYTTYTTGGYADRCILCHVVDIKFDFLERVGASHDVCTITFKTNEFYDFTKLLKLT